MGDIEIFADRFQYVEFTQPYVSSGLEMIVVAEADSVKERWIFKGVFTIRMWLLLALMHFLICSVVWLFEIQHHEGLKQELKGHSRDFGVMLWLSILLFAQSKGEKKNIYISYGSFGRQFIL